MDIANIQAVVENTIPISDFNRGKAGKIFEDVKRSGVKVVVKNNAVEGYVISPSMFAQIADELNDARLFPLAVERMKSHDPQKVLSHREVMQELGITDSDLDAVGEVEIE